MIGIIQLDIFNLRVAVFADEDSRIAELKEQGCNDLDRHNDRALASAHMDFTDDGGVRLSMVIKPIATKATWAHECVHIADFVMNYLSLPTGVTNTEIRAYMVGHLFSGIDAMMEAKP